MSEIIRFPHWGQARASPAGRWIARGGRAAYNGTNVPPEIATIIERGSPFRLGEWTVEPSLNRLTNGEGTVQLELKAMDLLLCLAERAGELVTRNELHDAVWQTEFVADNTLVKRVAQLREALGDDAKNPVYIETIPKRGYRLIAAVDALGRRHSASVLDGVGAPEARDGGVCPYPGLAPFSVADADNFFGREAEIKALWRKITSRRLLAVIGPSGVGKSSLIRAGVIAGAPEGWRAVVCQPGEAPFVALAQALAPDFAGHVDEVRQLLRFGDPDIALAMVSRWRGRWDRALVVVDQFEELFTLNSPEVQRRFIELLRRLVDAADVNVLLVMRDDFLFECHAHRKLAPIFTDITPLGPPAGVQLKRAIVEPAARQRFAFDSELLVDEMVAEVKEERGALPLLAFAVAQMWRHRDVEQRLLTTEAYQRIGGVAGALARHAEATLETIGTQRHGVVRELFRNLVTAHGTRAIRDGAELLSVFDPDSRDDAADVLRALIDARLLIAFDETIATRDDDDPTSPRVEIVHESLITSWPRLVRWRAQDAEGALLRDQLRQVSTLWRERGRPVDLLWTGTSYREFRLWRERYPGGLTAVEDEFAAAMDRHAGKRRRRQRAIGVGLVLVLVAVSVALAGLWQRSERNARRVEARRFLEIGRSRVNESPAQALAFAIASLELADDPETRQLALEVLERSPVPISVQNPGVSRFVTGVEFSPDGQWLATGSMSGHGGIYSADNHVARTWRAQKSGIQSHFTPDSRLVTTWGMGERSAAAWSVADGRRIGTIDTFDVMESTDVPTEVAASVGRAIRFVRDTDGVVGWKLDRRVETLAQELVGETMPVLAVDDAGEWIIVASDADVYAAQLVDGAAGFSRVGRCGADVEHVAFHPDGELFATIDVSGRVELWSLVSGVQKPLRLWKAPADRVRDDLIFDPTGRYLAAALDVGVALIWGIEDPPGADPFRIQPDAGRLIELAFHPDGSWLATASFHRASLWPFQRSRYPFVLRGHTGLVENLAFSPDGGFLVSSGNDGTVRRWPVQPGFGSEGIILDWGHPTISRASGMRLSWNGAALVSTGSENSVRVVSLDGGSVDTLGESAQRIIRAAISPDGTEVAAAGRFGDGWSMRVWNLETGEIFDNHIQVGDDFSDNIIIPMYHPDGSLWAASGGKLLRLDEDARRWRVVLEDVGNFSFSRDGGRVVTKVTFGAEKPMVATVHDLDDGTSTFLSSHGTQIFCAALDRTGDVVVTGNLDGIVRVGSASGAVPHQLISGAGPVRSVAVSPDNRWIAAGYEDGSIWLWPTPDLSRPPLHDVPHAEFLAKLEGLTNLRVAPDPEHPGNHIVKATEPFPGWETAPHW